MPSPNQKLRSAFAGRRFERDRRIQREAGAINRWTGRLLERVLGIIGAEHGGVSGVLGSVDVVLIGSMVDASAILEKALGNLWGWSYKSAGQRIIGSLPRDFWVRRHSPIPVAAMEAAGFDPEEELAGVLSGRVTGEAAQEVLRELEFPPPSAERVDQILAATNADDGLSAMERIRTVMPDNLAELRSAIVDGFSRADGVSALEHSRDRVRALIHMENGNPAGINYKARRILRTEGVRVSEAGLRESWQQSEDLISGIELISSHVPRSREEHIALEGTYHKTGTGEYIRADGTRLPQVPLGPNCLCWTSPVLSV